MKIPEGAERVFKGEIFEVYQWEQELFDGSKAIFERVKRPDTVQVIAVEEGKILVGDEKQPDRPKSVSLFGGRVDEGEDRLEAAKRELREESGYESDDWELFRTYSPVEKMDWDIHMYIARKCRKAAEPNLDAGEKIEIMKLTLEEFFDIMDSGRYRNTEFAVELYRIRNEEESLERFRERLFR